ncbi:MAG: BspA family leucine-rich repeat surface protein [Flavobacteriales bacterium]|nr:BspA family leucine-rich repeat surface protein [Flavobacteriales bacterium]
MQKLLTLLLLSLCSLIINAQIDSTHFVTTWRTSNPGFTNDSSIVINTVPFATYNYDVDWDNDGTFDDFGLTGVGIHQYADTGTYTVRIRGRFPEIFFGTNFPGTNGFDNQKIISIDQWGTQIWRELERAFDYCNNLEYNATDAPNLDSLTSLRDMFRDASKFNGNINNWDVSSIEDMTGLFTRAISFDQPLDNWDVSSVTNMIGMFFNATSFNQPLNNWDVGSVKYMGSMFEDASSFNQPLNSWNVDSVLFMAYMFGNASSFNQSLNNWNVSAVTNMIGMFSGATLFNGALNNWNVSAVIDMFRMFRGASSFNQVLNNWNVSAVTDMTQMFQWALNFNQPIDNWDVSSVTNLTYMFEGASSFNQPLNSWSINSGAKLWSMFEGASSFNQPLNNWDMKSADFLFYMFKDAISFNQNLSSWDIDSVLDMTLAFENSGLSTANYDSMLIAWNNKPHQMNVQFGAGGLTFCNGNNARLDLVIDGWTFSGDLYNCGIVGIDDLKTSAQNKLSISPNPSSGLVSIMMEEFPFNEFYFVSDLKGRVIQEGVLTSKASQVDFFNLSEGLYFLRVGKETKKMIISR